jgi:hypothetical protein
MSGPSDALVQRGRLEAALVARCWLEDAFRRRLLADPVGTVREAFGLDLAAAPGRAESWSDLDLEQIAGGKKEGAARP